MPHLAERLNEGCLSALFLGRRDEAYAPFLDEVEPGERILDVGCGGGWWSRRLAARSGPRGRVLGVDPSPSAIAFARQRAGATEDYRVGTMTALPAPDGSLDRVVTSLVVHHVQPDAQPAAFRELRRVLRPGGRLLVVELLRPTSPWAWAAFGWQGCVRASLPEERLRALAADAGFVEIATATHWGWLRWLRACAPAAHPA